MNRGCGLVWRRGENQSSRLDFPPAKTEQNFNGTYVFGGADIGPFAGDD